MPNLVPSKTGALTRQDPARLALFKRTVGRHLVGDEINIALEYCELYGANPFSKDLYFFCFGKPGEEDRNVVPVLSINLYRKIAARTGHYRPDPAPPRFTYDETRVDPRANPLGIVDCEVAVFRWSHGEWFPHTSRLRWEERAPIIISDGSKWIDDPSGAVQTEGKYKGRPKRIKQAGNGEPVRMLDPKKPNWRTMPETMMAKCVEADALRKGWPSEVSGSYVSGELDQAGHDQDRVGVPLIRPHVLVAHKWYRSPR